MTPHAHPCYYPSMPHRHPHPTTTNAPAGRSRRLATSVHNFGAVMFKPLPNSASERRTEPPFPATTWCGMVRFGAHFGKITLQRRAFDPSAAANNPGRQLRAASKCIGLHHISAKSPSTRRLCRALHAADGRAAGRAPRYCETRQSALYLIPPQNQYGGFLRHEGRDS